MPPQRIRSTTILCVKKGDDMVMIGDGQVSMGDTVLKPNAKKVRRIGNGKVLAGFAGHSPLSPRPVPPQRQ
jgi:ATP-dependent HslUV protease subunit HslV